MSDFIARTLVRVFVASSDPLEDRLPIRLAGLGTRRRSHSDNRAGEP
jgi:hypothetical protein